MSKPRLAVGTSHEFDDLKSWFKALYETLLGQSTGPRMGSFIILYGIEETKILIDRVLKEKIGCSLNRILGANLPSLTIHYFPC